MDLVSADPADFSFEWAPGTRNHRALTSNYHQYTVLFAEDDWYEWKQYTFNDMVRTYKSRVVDGLEEKAQINSDGTLQYVSFYDHDTFESYVCEFMR
jgi:hypothetical protein